MKRLAWLSVVVLSSVFTGFSQAMVPQVIQARPSQQPVLHSGSGTMPLMNGTEAQMPRARRIIASQAVQGSAYTPFQLSLVAPVQVPPSNDFDVGGLRLSLIYGECVNFDGLDIGFAARSQGHSNGWQINAISVVDGDGIGLQSGLLVNYVKGSYQGLQIACANYAEYGDIFQIGVYNGGGEVEGCQLGVINFAREMSGVQIGLVNVIQNKDIPFLPIINAYF